MNYGIGNVKGINAVPTIILSASQFTNETTCVLTAEQLNIALTNGFIYGILPNGAKYGLSKSNEDSTSIEFTSTLYQSDEPSATPLCYFIYIIKESGVAVLSNFEVGGGKQLYQHNIDMTYTDPLNWSAEKISICITNDSNEHIDSTDKLKTYLNEKGFTSVLKYLQVNGVYIYKNNATDIYNIFGIYKDNTIIRAIGTKANDTAIYYQLSFESGTYTDTIIEL